LEGVWGITQAKWKDFIGKGDPQACESSLILLFKADFDLIVLTETIHKSKELPSCKSIQNMVNKR